MTTSARWMALLSALVLPVAFAGCAGMGGLFGGDDAAQEPTATRGSEGTVEGTVERVDRGEQVILVRTETAASRELRERPEATRDVVTVRYGPETQVEYRGQQYQPEDLEPGDQILVRVDPSERDELMAQEIEVTGNVRDEDGRAS